jgi:hypothetical protein
MDFIIDTAISLNVLMYVAQLITEGCICLRAANQTASPRTRHLLLAKILTQPSTGPDPFSGNKIA